MGVAVLSLRGIIERACGRRVGGAGVGAAAGCGSDCGVAVEVQLCRNGGGAGGGGRGSENLAVSVTTGTARTGGANVIYYYYYFVIYFGCWGRGPSHSHRPGADWSLCIEYLEQYAEHSALVPFVWMIKRASVRRRPSSQSFLGMNDVLCMSVAHGTPYQFFAPPCNIPHNIEYCVQHVAAYITYHVSRATGTHAGRTGCPGCVYCTLQHYGIYDNYVSTCTSAPTVK
jgi:hypothetical protein